MATYTKIKLKSGKIKYRIQVKITDPITKKVDYAHTTWHNDDNLKDKQAERAAHAFGEDYEDKIRYGEPKTNIIVDPTFEQVTAKWLKLIEATKSDNYYIRACRAVAEFNNEWGNKKMRSFTKRDTKLFFENFSSRKYIRNTAILKLSMSDRFYNAVKENGFKRACTEDFSWYTLFSARKRESIQWNKAEAICKKFKLNVNEYFEKNTLEMPYMQETISGYQRILSAIFEYAIDKEWIDFNYATSKTVKKYMTGKKPEKVKVLNRSELLKLIEVLEDSPIEQSMPILLLAYLGLRKSEMCGLNWSDIDFEKRIISISQNRVYISKKGIIRKDTKNTYSVRNLHIPPRLFVKLQEYKQYYDYLKKDDPEFKTSNAVFCNYDGSPRNPGYVNILLNRFLEKARLQHITVHKLRHTWVTTMISAQKDPNKVAGAAGHSNVGTTLKIYSHNNPDADGSKELFEGVFTNTAISEPSWSF